MAEDIPAIPLSVTNRSVQELIYACLMSALNLGTPEIQQIPLSVTHRSVQELLYALKTAIDELVAGGGGSGTWGTITGTLSDQTDLQSALDGKIGGSTGATDNALVRADGTGGRTAQGGAITQSDAGSLELPEGQKVGSGGGGVRFSNNSTDIMSAGAAVANFGNNILELLKAVGFNITGTFGNSSVFLAAITGHILTLVSSVGSPAIFRACFGTDPATTNFAQLSHDGTDAHLDTGAGKVIINGAIPATDGTYSFPTSITIVNGIITAIA